MPYTNFPPENEFRNVANDKETEGTRDAHPNLVGRNSPMTTPSPSN